MSRTPLFPLEKLPVRNRVRTNLYHVTVRRFPTNTHFSLLLYTSRCDIQLIRATHMASICQIKGKWRALIRRKGFKPVSKYFPTRREAEAWSRRIETGIDEGRPATITDDATVGQLVEEFRKLRLTVGRPIEPESNQHYMLCHLVEDLGPERVIDLTPTRMVQWARARQKQGAGGATVNMELSQLGTVLRHTASFLNLRLPDIVGVARPQLHYLQLISGGRRRSRRPVGDELPRLLDWVRERDPRVADAIAVMAITGLRRGELARMRWQDIDHNRRSVLVHKRKHPRIVEARDEVVPLLGRAYELVTRQGKVEGEDRVFPFREKRITQFVTDGTRELGIPDLHLHDMRREATSVLRELGFDLDERKAITGHRSDAVHERYIAVTLESLHEKYAAAVRDNGPDPSHPRTGSDRPT